MKRVRWKLTTGVVVALILTSVGAAGGSQSEASTSVRRTHYSLQPMSIQFNTNGGVAMLLSTTTRMWQTLQAITCGRD